jgi:DNA topoisomerase-1
MEDDLDRIAGGQEEALPWLSRFYFGSDAAEAVLAQIGLKAAVTSHIDEIDPREINTLVLGADENGEVVTVRSGKYGPYLTRGEDRASIPDDTLPDELTVERALELLLAPSNDRELGVDPTTGFTVFAKAGRYGPYVQLGEMVGKEKPKTASLFKDMEIASLTLDQGLQLLTIPRLVGEGEDGTAVETFNGRYGPYVKKGTDSRSLETEGQIFTLTMDEAQAIFAQPKVRRGRGVAAPALKEFGPDPESGTPIVAKDGRFGIYVTDGTTNASLRKGDDLETLTVERAQELLADRRAAGPSKKKATKKVAAKKAPAKKATKRATAAKKAPAKKTALKATQLGSVAQDDPPF